MSDEFKGKYGLALGENLEARVTTNQYKAHLPDLYPMLKQLSPDGRGLLQDDPAPTHRMCGLTECFNENYGSNATTFIATKSQLLEEILESGVKERDALGPGMREQYPNK